MGLFANLRKNKSEYDGSDDWLFELQDDVGSSELESSETSPGPAPEYEAFDVAAAAAPTMNTFREAPPAAPLAAESGASRLGGWHLPDVENDRRVSEPGPAFELSYEITEPGPVAFAEPETPSYEPIDSAQPPAAGQTPVSPAWADAPPPAPPAPPTLPAPPVPPMLAAPPAGRDRWAPEPESAVLGVGELDAADREVCANEHPANEDPANEDPANEDRETWAPIAEPVAGFGPSSAEGPTAPEATVLLEILGLFPGATWDEVREAHRELIDGHRAEPFTDEAQAKLAEEIRREMNSAYAALRLLAVSY